MPLPLQPAGGQHLTVFHDGGPSAMTENQAYGVLMKTGDVCPEIVMTENVLYAQRSAAGELDRENATYSTIPDIDLQQQD